MLRRFGHTCSLSDLYHHSAGLQNEMCGVWLGRWFEEKRTQKDSRQMALSWEQIRNPIFLLEDKINSKSHVKAISSIPLN